MKMLDFLKGGTMKIQFNESQLSRPQQESLINVLDVLQVENKNELVVTPVEFPIKLKVKLDDDIEMLLGWDTEQGIYAGLTTPERLEQDIKDLAKEIVQEPEPIPESQKDTVDLPTPETEPEPDLDLSPVIVRVEALARTFVNLTKPLDAEQRCEVWISFITIFIRELWK